MGIRGLTSYINKRSDHYLRYYELHDTYLVIDANNISAHLYTWYAKCNNAFGGDYDKYAQCVSDFFDDLLKCNVTPLVLIDGGFEKEKLQNVLQRNQSRIESALSVSPVNQENAWFFPVLMREVFNDVVRGKNIKLVQCLFEADNTIAIVANILDCPVLSYDSDFYMYAASYIPFKTLDGSTVRRNNGNGFMKRCQIYRTEYLLNAFKGLDQSVLRLAAMLLGDNHEVSGTFKNFFRYLKIEENSKVGVNYWQRIETTFTWLSNCTLNEAVIEILSRLRKPERQTILDMIETNIQSNINAVAEIFVLLGFSKDYVTQMNTHSGNETFKFDGDINTLTYIEEVCEDDDSETSKDEEEDEAEIQDILKNSKLVSINELINSLPTWFVNAFLMGQYSPYFIDLILRRLYICPVQVEDNNYPSSIIISEKIISVIFGLLISGQDSNIGSMKYVTRGTGTIKHKCFELEGTSSIISGKLLSLFNLREIPLITRREILNHNLGIVDKQHISELPPEWMLYIACINYWLQQKELYRSQKYYLYSLLICMLFNIIDSKVEKFRCMYNFQHKYSNILKTIQHGRGVSISKQQYLTNVAVTDAYNKIDHNDCLLAAPFFISHFNMDRKLYLHPERFNKSIVHGFAEFQSCLVHIMNLNALLGHPYQQPKVANLFNGTFLYNLCNNLSFSDIDTYINTNFQKSPSLLRIFNALLFNVERYCTLCLE